MVSEAAYGGLPIVLCDPLAPACFEANSNGLVAADDPADFADKVIRLLSDPKLYHRFSRRSIKLASELTETNQTKKLVKVYRQALRRERHHAD